MKIVNTYTDRITDLITGDQSYELDDAILLQLGLDDYTPGVFERPEIVLNVLTGGNVGSAFTLERNTDFYVKNNSVVWIII